jgi:hypothetical protein
LRPLKKTRASSNKTAPSVISAIGLIVCFVVVVAPDEPPSVNTMISPQVTVIAIAPSQKPSSRRSGRGSSRITVTQARSVG